MALGKNPLVYLKLYQNKNSTDTGLGELLSDIVAIELILGTAKVSQIKMLPGKWIYLHILFYFLSLAENTNINTAFGEVRQIVFDRDAKLFQTREMIKFLKRYCKLHSWQSIEPQYGFSLYI
jgi:hypothetical protein